MCVRGVGSARLMHTPRTPGYGYQPYLRRVPERRTAAGSSRLEPPARARPAELVARYVFTYSGTRGVLRQVSRSRWEVFRASDASHPVLRRRTHAWGYDRKGEGNMRKLIAMLAALVVTMVFAGTAAAAISITPAPAGPRLPEPVAVQLSGQDVRFERRADPASVRWGRTPRHRWLSSSSTRTAPSLSPGPTRSRTRGPTPRAAIRSSRNRGSLGAPLLQRRLRLLVAARQSRASARTLGAYYRDLSRDVHAQHNLRDRPAHTRRVCVVQGRHLRDLLLHGGRLADRQRRLHHYKLML